MSPRVARPMGERRLELSVEAPSLTRPADPSDGVSAGQAAVRRPRNLGRGVDRTRCAVARARPSAGDPPSPTAVDRALAASADRGDTRPMSGARGAGPGPDGHHDDLLPEDLDGLTLHVPDDATRARRRPATAGCRTPRRCHRRPRSRPLSATGGPPDAGASRSPPRWCSSRWRGWRCPAPSAPGSSARTPPHRRPHPWPASAPPPGQIGGPAARGHAGERRHTGRPRAACDRSSSPWCPRSALSAPSCLGTHRPVRRVVRCLPGGGRRPRPGRPARRPPQHGRHRSAVHRQRPRRRPAQHLRA